MNFYVPSTTKPLDWVLSELVSTAVQKGGVDEAVALSLLTSGFWSFSQILMGLSRDPLPMFWLGVASPLLEVGESLKLVHAYKSKGRRELKNLNSSINYNGSSRGEGMRV